MYSNDLKYFDRLQLGNYLESHLKGTYCNIDGGDNKRNIFKVNSDNISSFINNVLERGKEIDIDDIISKNQEKISIFLGQTIQNFDNKMGYCELPENVNKYTHIYSLNSNSIIEILKSCKQGFIFGIEEYTEFGYEAFCGTTETIRERRTASSYCILDDERSFCILLCDGSFLKIPDKVNKITNISRIDNKIYLIFDKGKEIGILSNGKIKFMNSGFVKNAAYEGGNGNLILDCISYRDKWLY